jgi:predicted transcriptional regulator
MNKKKISKEITILAEAAKDGHGILLFSKNCCYPLSVASMLCSHRREN